MSWASLFMGVSEWVSGGGTFTQAWDRLNIDKGRVARSAGENLVKGKYSAPTLSAAGDMIAYMMANDDWTWEGALQAAGEGGLSAILSDKLAGVFTKKLRIGNVTGGVKNVVPDGKQANHIFLGRPGKLTDTVTNRDLITDLTSDSKNLLGTDKYGKTWYTRTLDDGSQLHGHTQDGIVKGAGINEKPLDIIKNKS